MASCSIKHRGNLKLMYNCYGWNLMSHNDCKLMFQWCTSFLCQAAWWLTINCTWMSWMLSSVSMLLLEHSSCHKLNLWSITFCPALNTSYGWNSPCYVF
jgi:hypothetical protein